MLSQKNNVPRIILHPDAEKPIQEEYIVTHSTAGYSKFVPLFALVLKKRIFNQFDRLNLSAKGAFPRQLQRGFADASSTRFLKEMMACSMAKYRHSFYGRLLEIRRPFRSSSQEEEIHSILQ
ncbi:unnamed protein product [Caenorhabditis auriculariae]|uniref:Uncharacterized protein n=1 Tax=Caenorhabditis auriculariae TaxID=2777116 RepID=A0A8S1GY43_9PELO|nr:unnamed protein product [Caenorhabditis auriculariae]